MSMSNPVLSAVRLEFRAIVQSPLDLPPYAGSMLRGAFGHALLTLAPLPHTDGKPCRLQETCPYCQVFCPAPIEHSLQKFSRMPLPFVIEPPAGGVRLKTGSRLDFSLVLIGKGLKHLPIVILAFRHALKSGLGHQRAGCQLVAVYFEGDHENSVWVDTRPGDIRVPDTLPLPDIKTPGMSFGARVRLLTPLRLQAQGSLVRNINHLYARTFLVTLARRYQLLADIHLGTQAPQLDFGMLAEKAEAIQLKPHELRWFDWGRYSQRQHREMKLGGLLGEFSLLGRLDCFSELLHTGQWLHLGKNTSFGLGRYLVDPL